MAIWDLFRKDKAKPSDGTVVNEVDQLFNTDLDQARILLEQTWYRNILYYIGEQWIEFVKTRASFRRRVFPDFVPTPVANEIKDYVRSQKALLLNQRLVPKVWPNSSDVADVKASELAQDLLTWMDTINDSEIEAEKEKCAIWICLTGTTFMRTFPEMSGGRWGMTKQGELITTGEVVTQHVSPFNVVLDWNGGSLREKSWIGIKTLRNKEWIEDNFKVKMDRSDSAPFTDYQRNLMRLVAEVSPWKSSQITTASYDALDENTTMFKEIEFRPTKAYPNGRYIVSAGGKLLLDVPKMPIPVIEGDFHYTLTDFHFDYCPGRFWSEAGTSDLISSQNAINEIMQALAINRKSLGRSRVVTPGLIGLKKLSEAGQAFLAISYDPLLSGGKEPKIEQGTPLPTQVLEELRIHKQQIQDSAGDPKNILKGQSPSANSSGIQVDILRETAERSHQPDVKRFSDSMQRVAKKRLLLAQVVYTEERVVKIAGSGSQVKVMKFKAADLRNNTDVRLELDSGSQATQAGKNQTLIDLATKGFLGPVAEDPDLRNEMLTRLGLAGFTDQQNVHIERAKYENVKIASGILEGIFLTEAGPPPMDPETGQPGMDPETGQPAEGEPVVKSFDPVFKYDDHMVHFEIHRRFMLGKEFAELDPKLQATLIAHADIHHLMVVSMQAAQAEAEAEQNAPQGGPNAQGKPKQGGNGRDSGPPPGAPTGGRGVSPITGQRDGQTHSRRVSRPAGGPPNG